MNQVMERLMRAAHAHREWTRSEYHPNERLNQELDDALIEASLYLLIPLPQTPSLVSSSE